MLKEMRDEDSKEITPIYGKTIIKISTKVCAH